VAGLSQGARQAQGALASQSDPPKEKGRAFARPFSKSLRRREGLHRVGRVLDSVRSVGHRVSRVVHRVS
jgi:hypothetical protein